MNNLKPKNVKITLIFLGSIFLLLSIACTQKADPQKVKQYIQDLNNNNVHVRFKAAKALGEIKDPKSVAPLIIALKDTNNYVGQEAARALGKIKDPKAVKPLIALLKDAESIAAAFALGEIKDLRAVDPLIEALKYSDRDVRREAARALGKIKDPKAVKPLIALLKDAESIAAAEALGKIKDPKSVTLLIAILKDRGPEARMAAFALGEIKDPSAVDSLIEALKHPDNLVRQNAAEALGKIEDPRAMAPLILALNDTSWGVKDEAKGALRKMRRVPTTSSLEPLIENLTDWHTNQESAKVLSKHGWKPQSEKDKIHYLVAKRKKRDLRQQWNLAKKVLLKDLESSEYRTIENALLSFIGIGKDEIIPELIEKLNARGNKTMAEAYLNCGHIRLNIAAKNWAERHGYRILPGRGAKPVKWGSM